uniref:hypothetical protein n=1 Tax=Klebsiella pneumoniae TaxID=573 RepID=UPI0021A78BE2
GLAIDQIAQSGLSSLSVIYYSAQLFSERTGMQFFFLITNASLNSLFNLADVRIKFSRQQRSWD